MASAKLAKAMVPQDALVRSSLRKIFPSKICCCSNEGQIGGVKFLGIEGADELRMEDGITLLEYCSPPFLYSSKLVHQFAEIFKSSISLLIWKSSRVLRMAGPAASLIPFLILLFGGKIS